MVENSRQPGNSDFSKTNAKGRCQRTVFVNIFKNFIAISTGEFHYALVRQ